MLLAPSAKGLQRLLDVSYNYGCDNDMLFNRVGSQIMFLYTRKTVFGVDIKLGDAVLSITKSYKYLGHIICDDLSDGNDIKSKERSLYGRSIIIFRKCYFCSKKVNNKLFASYCSNVYLCSLWANYRKAAMQHFNVSYNNAFRIMHNLSMRCCATTVLVLLILTLNVVML